MKNSEDELIHELKQGNTVESIATYLQEQIPQYGTVTNNTAKKSYLQEIYYNLSALLSLMNDEFKAQDTFADFSLFACKYTAVTSSVIATLKTLSALHGARPAWKASITEYRKHFSAKLKAKTGSDFL